MDVDTPDNMDRDPSTLIAAVNKALGRTIDWHDYDDRLIMQKGCYILNRWGYGPYYGYGLYIRGPYSTELTDDCERMILSNLRTDIPEEALTALSGIIKRGTDYLEAYTTVMLVKENNPSRNSIAVMKKALDIRPSLKDLIEEACSLILTDCRSKTVKRMW